MIFSRKAGSNSCTYRHFFRQFRCSRFVCYFFSSLYNGPQAVRIPNNVTVSTIRKYFFICRPDSKQHMDIVYSMCKTFYLQIYFFLSKIFYFFHFSFPTLLLYLALIIEGLFCSFIRVIPKNSLSRYLKKSHKFQVSAGDNSG